MSNSKRSVWLTEREERLIKLLRTFDVIPDEVAKKLFGISLDKPILKQASNS